MTERQKPNVQPREILTDHWQVIRTHPPTLHGKLVSSKYQIQLSKPDARGALLMGNVELALNLVRQDLKKLLGRS